MIDYRTRQSAVSAQPIFVKVGVMVKI